jgi:hypothetical protein
MTIEMYIILQKQDIGIRDDDNGANVRLGSRNCLAIVLSRRIGIS